MTALAQVQEVVVPPSFAEIYAQHASFVLRAVRRLGVARPDVPDAGQQVFLTVHRRLDSFDGSSTVRTWLFGICRRVAADLRARAHVRREVPTDKLPERSEPPAQHQAVERVEARAVLDRFLDLLDDDKRAVFVLYELEEWTMPEVAAAVGCPLQTAYTRFRAARKTLEEAMQRALGPRSDP